jgi:SMI1-KNR4 cell-wall
MTKKKVRPLDRLQSLIPPPAEPVEAGPLALRTTIEQSLGLALPDDLYDFVLVYGSGGFRTPDFSGLLHVHNPFSPTFVELENEWLTLLRTSKAYEDESYIPFGIHPDKPGLFHLGYDDGGRFVFWLTEGDPNEWPILVWTLEKTFQRIDDRLVDFLINLFSGKIDCWGAGHDAAWFKAHAKEITFRAAKPSKPRTSEEGGINATSAGRKRRKKETE